jgi:hypothetical protein
VIPRTYPLMGCLAVLTVTTGCSTVGYSRISGAGYYGWLASSTQPVIQHRDLVLGRSCIRLEVSDEKGRFRFFVTDADLALAAKGSPECVLRARAYQEAYLMGMASGAEQAFRKMPSEASLVIPAAPAVPETLVDYSSYWVEGWEKGYQYGYRDLAMVAFGNSPVAMRSGRAGKQPLASVTSDTRLFRGR